MCRVLPGPFHLPSSHPDPSLNSTRAAQARVQVQPALIALRAAHLRCRYGIQVPLGSRLPLLCVQVRHRFLCLPQEGSSGIESGDTDTGRRVYYTSVRRQGQPASGRGA